MAGKGQITQYQYDALSRLNRIAYGGSTNVDLSYTVLGQVAAISNPHATETLGYDALSRVTNTTTLSIPGFSNVSYRLDYAYDKVGNTTNLVVQGLTGFSDTLATEYEYDNMDRLVSVSSNGMPVLECWYDGIGRRVAKREVAEGQRPVGMNGEEF